ncbi:hypothetical protein VR611_13245 [Aquirufa nivalisilvae]|jgi:hypothetical protein
MQQNLQLNIIPFSAPVQEAEFAFYTSKKDGYCPIHKDDLNGAIEGIIDESELHYGNWLYTDFAPAKENAILISINHLPLVNFFPFNLLIKRFLQLISSL